MYYLRLHWGSPKPLSFSDNTVAAASSMIQNAFSQVDDDVVIQTGLLLGEEKQIFE